MHHDKLNQLRGETKLIRSELEIVEQNISALRADFDKEKKLKHLARLLYADKVVEKAGLLFSFNEHTLCQFLAANKTKLQKPTKIS